MCGCYRTKKGSALLPSLVDPPTPSRRLYICLNKCWSLLRTRYQGIVPGCDIYLLPGYGDQRQTDVVRATFSTISVGSWRASCCIVVAVRTRNVLLHSQKHIQSAFLRTADAVVETYLFSSRFPLQKPLKVYCVKCRVTSRVRLLVRFPSIVPSGTIRKSCTCVSNESQIQDLSPFRELPGTTQPDHTQYPHTRTTRAVCT